MIMSLFIKELVKRKLNQLSYKDILHYSNQYGFALSIDEARHIETYIHNNKIDPFCKNDRLKMFQTLAEITNIETANKAQSLLDEVIHTYGLTHLFDE